jgi:hypothetical protein
MRFVLNLFHIAIVFALLGLPQVVTAADISVRSKFIRFDAAEGSASGKLRIWVRNLSDKQLKNVNLRVQSPAEAKLDKGVIQIRKIPKGHARVARGEIFFVGGDFDPKQNLVWAVEYDVKKGEHKQAVINDRR